LAPREVKLVPWDTVCIDLIGPWKIKVAGQDVVVRALTCIDPVTNLTELVRIENKTMEHVAQQFENVWLSRYPRPNYCVFDNGGEFIGHKFQELLTRFGITPKPITVKNPQANAICERMHQTVANVLRTLMHAHPPQNDEQAHQLVDNALATAMHVTRCAVSQSLGISPGEFVFRRDMLMDIPILVDLATLRDKRQALVDKAVMRENARRYDYNYAIGQYAYVKVWEPDKLQERLEGPHLVTRVFTNGTVELALTPHTRTTFSIRRLVPKK
jgi:hypothetical protein